MFMYGGNVYAWQKTRINYVFIFEFSPGTELRYRQILLVCTIFSSMLLATMIAHLVISNNEAPKYYSSEFAPMVISLVRLLLLMLLQFGYMELIASHPCDVDARTFY